MPKYLKEHEIKKNHIYVDSKGFEMIYLGQASQDNGDWSYPLCHIYVKRERLNEYPNTMPLEDVLNALGKKGVRHYCFSEKPRKMVKEVGVEPRPEIHGKAGMFEFID